MSADSHTALDREPSPDVLLALYNVAVDSVKAFWDWRHKLITVLLAVVSALGIASAAIQHLSTTDQIFVATPLFVGSVFSFSVVLMDVRTGRVIDAGIEQAKKLEAELAGQGLGFFHGWSKQGKFFRFGFAIRALGLMLGTGLLALGAWILC